MLFELGGTSEIFEHPSLFKWRSGGGGQAKIVTEEAVVHRNKLARKDGLSGVILGRPREAEPMPKEPKMFFREMLIFFDLDMREENGVMTVAVENPGGIIGKGGRWIKAIEKHLGRRIKVVQGERVAVICHHGADTHWTVVGPWSPYVKHFAPGYPGTHGGNEEELGDPSPWLRGLPDLDEEE